MDLKNILAVSGLPGLYYLKANRSNGLIIEDLATGKNRFASVRKHKFTPLESIGIFTQMDSLEMAEVFQRMKSHQSLPLPAEEANDEEVMSYFGEIVKDYDRTRVHIKDMRKVLRWFRFLDGRKMLGAEEEE